MNLRKNIFIAAIALLLLAGLVTGSGLSAINAQSPSPSPTLPAGSTVEVVGVWGDEELASFQAMVAPWEQQTGARMNFTSTRDLNTMQRWIQTGNPPSDVAILPVPGLVSSLARTGNLQPLTMILDMNLINQQYSPMWLDTGSVDGQLYALPIKATNKAMIWYNPGTFSSNGWEVPATWDQLIALSNTIVSANNIPAYPWAMGVNDGASSGWPGTDWIAQIFLSKYGGEAYDQWVAHEIPWTDPRIKDAWEIWGSIAYTEGYVPGGTSAILATNFQDAALWPFLDPPEAAMYYEGDFVQGFISARFPDLVAGEDYSFFPFPGMTPFSSPAPPDTPPPTSPSVQQAITGGADLVTVIEDTPVVRSFVSYLATPQAQTIWAERGGFTSVNTAVDLSAYPNDLLRQSAQKLLNASLFRFGAGDLMPAEVQTTWWSGILEYLENRDNLDSILQNIENIALTAYQIPTIIPTISPSMTEIP
jgi:alpha-glucoside transport system substrate-binding protein